MRCGECGSKSIFPKCAMGRSFPYKEHEKVKLRVSVKLPTCLDCGNILFTNGDAEKLDKAIETTLEWNEADLNY